MLRGQEEEEKEEKEATCLGGQFTVELVCFVVSCLNSLSGLSEIQFTVHLV